MHIACMAHRSIGRDSRKLDCEDLTGVVCMLGFVQLHIILILCVWLRWSHVTITVYDTPNLTSMAGAVEYITTMNPRLINERLLYVRRC